MFRDQESNGLDDVAMVESVNSVSSVVHDNYGALPSSLYQGGDCEWRIGGKDKVSAIILLVISVLQGKTSKKETQYAFPGVGT